MARSGPAGDVCVRLVDGMRVVEPYTFRFRVAVKRRWHGMAVRALLEREFGYAPETARKLVDEGTFTVNGERCKLEQTLFEGDELANETHRHEPPVPATLVVLHEDEDVLVVDKPSGVPVHPGGRFFANTVTEMLRATRREELFVVHRLDRLTSGVLLLARSSLAARRLKQHGCPTDKVYLCRLLGTVEDCVVDLPLREPTSVSVGSVVVDRVGGKHATTSFRKVFHDAASNTTVVEAIPTTGRMHQIRAHAAAIGHPIANDARYRGALDHTVVLAPTVPGVAGCVDCQEGCTVSDETLWLHALSAAVTAPNRKTFTAPAPPWAAAEFDARAALEAWDAAHQLRK